MDNIADTIHTIEKMLEHDVIKNSLTSLRCILSDALSLKRQ